MKWKGNGTRSSWYWAVTRTKGTQAHRQSHGPGWTHRCVHMVRPRYPRSSRDFPVSQLPDANCKEKSELLCGPLSENAPWRPHHGDRTPRLTPTVNQAQRLPEGLSRGKETPAGHKGDTPLSPQTASPPWGPADLPQEGGGASLPCLLPFKQSFLYLSNQNQRSW